MPTSRTCWRIWSVALLLWFAIWLYPVSNRLTRGGGVLLLAILAIGLIALVWRRRMVRFGLLALVLGTGIFLAWPGKGTADSAALRQAYLQGLKRYAGVTYYWGGESPGGIDCSGLIRRGMIDGLWSEGWMQGKPALVRESIDLWWHDGTANDMLLGYAGRLAPVSKTRSLNALHGSDLAPGDVAVTDSGLHVLAYLGSDQWIEADPTAGRVITVPAPAPDNLWFQMPMHVLRWRLLE